MKKLLSFIALIVGLNAFGAETPKLAVLEGTDQARVAAMQSPDGDKLQALLSDDLHYAHSNGLLDTKSSFIESLVTGNTKYIEYVSEERKFTFPVPSLALMTGRTRVRVQNASGNVAVTLNYLAVWREEQGQWRLLAWQSCRLPSGESTSAPAPVR